MSAHISHEKADRHPTDCEGCDHAHKQGAQLFECKGKAEFHQLQSACSQHGGQGEKEAELRGGGAGYSQQQSAQYGCPRAGGAGDEGQHLEYADEEGQLVVYTLHGGDGGLVGGLEPFDEDEEDAVDYQRGDDNRSVVEPTVNVLACLCFKYLIKQDGFL